MVRRAPERVFLHSTRDPRNTFVWPLVYQWFIRKKLRATGGGSTCTHTLLDAKTVLLGSVCVPDDKMDEFVHMYCESIKQGDFVYLNEHLAKELPQRLFMDFDMTVRGDLSTVPEAEIFDQLVRCVYDIVAENCDDPRTREMVVLSAGMTLKGTEESRESRLGLHLVWPNLVVSQAVAFALRRSIVVGLGYLMNTPHKTCATLCDGRFGCTQPWFGIVDVSVISGRNLRMPYSRKCKSDKKNGCACGAKDDKSGRTQCQCYRSVLDEGRPYLPLYLVDGGGVLHDITTRDMESVVKMAMIRVPSSTPLSKLSVESHWWRDVYIADVDESTVGGTARGASSGGQIKDVADDVRALVNDYVHTRWRSYVQPGQVVNVKRQPSQIIATVGTRCVNAVRGQHTSASTSIKIQRDGRVLHTCWSNKVVRRRFHACSEPKLCDRLAKHMIDLLFPSSKNELGRPKLRECDASVVVREQDEREMVEA